MKTIYSRQREEYECGIFISTGKFLRTYCESLTLKNVIRVLRQILIFREKICLCKKLFGNHILIIFPLKKDFFTFNKVFKKARILLASLLSKVVSAHVSMSWAETTKESKLAKRTLAFFLTLLNVKKSFFNVNMVFYTDIVFL